MAMINYANKVALNQNSNIADINKVKADDMNNIKSAINQLGAYLSATVQTGQPGKCYITAPGTLSTGDAFNVILPTAVNPSALAQFSADGGATYYYIRDIHGSQIIIADVATKRVTLLFDGTNFIVLGFKNCITAFLNAPSTSTVAQYNLKQAVLNTEFAKSGKSLVLSNGFIKNVSTTPIDVTIGGVMNLNLPETKYATIGVALYSTDNMSSYVKHLANVYSVVPATLSIYSFSSFMYTIPAGYALALVVQNQSASGSFVIYGRTTELATYISVCEK